MSRKDLEAFDAQVAPDLAEVLDDWIKILERSVELVKAEIVGGSAGRTLTKELAVKLREVTSALERSVAAEERLRKTAKERAARTTPAQKLAALQKLVARLPYQERRDFIRACIEEHNALRVAAIEARLESPADLPDHTERLL